MHFACRPSRDGPEYLKTLNLNKIAPARNAPANGQLLLSLVCYPIDFVVKHRLQRSSSPFRRLAYSAPPWGG